MQYKKKKKKVPLSYVPIRTNKIKHIVLYKAKCDMHSVN